MGEKVETEWEEVDSTSMQEMLSNISQHMDVQDTEWNTSVKQNCFWENWSTGRQSFLGGVDKQSAAEGQCTEERKSLWSCMNAS